MSLEEQIKTILTENPGQLAKEIASKLGVDKKQVNSLLYGRLRVQFVQDKNYRWWPPEQKGTATKIDDVQRFANTPLSLLARYYLACLGQDDIGQISVFARDSYGNPDYVTLNQLPVGGLDALFQEAEPAGLLNKMHRDRNPKIMYLGYPCTLRHHQSAKGWEGYFLEPVLLIPVEFELPNNRGSASLSQDYPIFNTAVLKRFSNVENDGLMDELVQLEEELGLNEVVGNLPDLDEVVQRLQSIRNEWPWKEDCDANAMPEDPLLADITEPGIYNRAVLLIAERKPYTQGLENELRELAKLGEHSYAGTALGHLVNGSIPKSHSIVEEPLIEVLPLNSEQRHAIQQSLTQPLTIITGPPGTGKSQVVTNLLVNAAWRGQKVLFASKNNKAVDVVEVRVNNLGQRPVLLRLGSNEYQTKLKDYLQALLAATATEDDRLEHNEANSKHNFLVEEIRRNEEEQTGLINLRNEVDQLEQSVESIRKLVGGAYFAKIKTLDLASINEKICLLLDAISLADKTKAGLLLKLSWPLQRKKLYERVKFEGECCQLMISELQMKLPDRDPDDLTMLIWLKFSESLQSRMQELSQAKEYFNALNRLHHAESLENISLKHKQLLDKLASNSDQLWRSWLKVAPTKLNQEDRQLLSQYISIIQMLIDSGRNRPNKQVWSQYFSLFPKVSKFFPCWAVTSLSARGKLPFTAGFFDLVVFDEASQCDIASALPLLYRAKRVAVIGDPMQLSHISSIHKNQDQQLLDRFELIEKYTQWAYSWNSLFDMARSYAQAENIISLRDHHRSHADIINFSNDFFYEGRLRVATHYDRLIRPSMEQPGVRWIDVHGNVQRPAEGSAINRPEAEAIKSELSRLALEQGYKGSIGVVSPFRAQANLIKELCIKDNTLQSSLDNLEFLSDTVHKFQGDERDLIIFSPVVSENVPIQALGFLRRNGNLFNVAITRARGMLLVIGDKSGAKNSDVEYLAEFAHYVDQLEEKQEAVIQTNEMAFGPEYPSVADRSKVSDWEVIFYKALYKAGIRTIPQYPVEQYLLDFALINGSRRLNIEIDGERYHRNWTGELCRRDQIRNQRMYELGWDVLRFWVYEVRDDLDNCIKMVNDWLNHKGE